MPERQQVTVLIAYASVGAILFIASIALTYSPALHRDPFADQDVPRSSIEQLASILALLSPATLYAAFGLAAIRRTRRRGYIPLGYAIWAPIIALVLTVGFGGFADAIQHIDCADNCVASVPTYAEMALNHAVAWSVAAVMSLGALVASIAGRARARASLLAN